MNGDISQQHHQTFGSIKRKDADDNEFWLARELSRVLDYSEFRHFQPAVDCTREACRNSGQAPENHFEDFLDMVEVGSGATMQSDCSLLQPQAMWGNSQNHCGGVTRMIISFAALDATSADILASIGVLV
jgi:DNA-damage-inducible protein D